jgi:hypothetical protein
VRIHRRQQTVTQIHSVDRGRPIEDQAHQPLMFLSGTVTGVAERWAIIEKEAFALVEKVKGLITCCISQGAFCCSP